MSRTTQCDCCKRCEPDVSINHHLRKRWRWLNYQFDSQDGSYREIDICKECWVWIQSTIQNKIMAKPASSLAEIGNASIVTFEKPTKCAELEPLQFDKPKENLKAPEYDKVSEGYKINKKRKK